MAEELVCVKAMGRWGKQSFILDGQRWEIGTQGIWVPRHIAERLIQYKRDFYCGHAKGWVTVQPLFIAGAK